MPFKDLGKRRHAVRECQARRRKTPAVKAYEAAYSAQRYASDVSFRRKEKARQIFRNYGITIEEYESSIVAQGNRCAICKEVFIRSPHLDHSHATGQLRKFLCDLCNKGLGQFRDNADLLRVAADYLEDFERQLNENI